MTLEATDADIARLIHTARTRREGDHATGGNLFADCLDALINHAYDEDVYSAEVLLDIAQQLYDRSDKGDDDDCHSYEAQRTEAKLAGVCS